MSDAIHDRVTNAAGVSVGTALAFESVLSEWPIFDESRKHEFKNITEFDQVYLNAATVFRNLVNCVDTDARLRLDTTVTAEALAEECRAIREAIERNSFNKTKVVFYHNTYRDLKTKFVSDKLYEPTTPKQIYYADLQTKVLKYLAQALHNPQKSEGLVENNTSMVSKDKGRTLLLTHFPIDLILTEHLGPVTLLESHTGVLKQKNQWYTKLYGGKDLSMIPFSKMAIQIFGDGVHFRPQDPKVKKAVIELAEAKKWTWMTSESAQKAAIRTMADQFFAQLLLKMYN